MLSCFTFDLLANEPKTIDLGASTVESNLRQPPTQVTENPNQISSTAKEILTEDFFEFENQILQDLKNNK